MGPTIPVASLLDAPSGVNDGVDVRAELESIAGCLDTHDTVRIPQHVADWIAGTASYFRANPPPLTDNITTHLQPSTPIRSTMRFQPQPRSSTCSPARFLRGESTPTPVHTTSPHPSLRAASVQSALSVASDPLAWAPQVTFNIRLNRQTVLSKLYSYNDIDAHVEYPQTSADDGHALGHLFCRDPNNWLNPAQDFAYSLDKPSGVNRRHKGQPIMCSLLVDEAGDQVPCIETHSTCQGSKACPYTNLVDLRKVHVEASREDVQRRLHHDRERLLSVASPSRDIFQKTSALIAALRKVGCRALADEKTELMPSEQEHQKALLLHEEKLSRGYKPSQARCRGRLSMDFTKAGKPYIVCEHYDLKYNRDHYIHHLDHSYDIDYLEAHFNEDAEELDRIEETARLLGYGPLSQCTHITNFSDQTVGCPFDHRNSMGHLIRPELIHLSCTVKVRIFEPLESHRQSCPFIFVVLRGGHAHPIPLPQKTPPKIRSEVHRLLSNVGEDLADLTPRRFLCHPILKAYLSQRFPEFSLPALSDLHVSLANRSHLKSYINQVKQIMYPEGTGWEGLLHLKKQQDLLPPEDQYIRRIIEITSKMENHDEDELDVDGHIGLKIIICMSPEGSRRLAQAQYIQSDIGFKCIVDYYEFEMACIDRVNNTSIVFCRVYLTRQTAMAHFFVFQEIEKIVLLDTGRSLKWRHLHAHTAHDAPAGMILQWAVDQHGGQAKGLGLHLQALAQDLPSKYDLHECHRLVSSLSPYKHLWRLLRLCIVHALRNIKKCAVTNEVRDLMRSLICMTHNSWDATIDNIKRLGGKAGADWVNDKVRSKFAFQALCWEKSFIPELVWRAGDANTNLIESVHADVNREGLHCTLLGGIKKGQAFDQTKMNTLRAFENAGIRPSYHSGHVCENITKGVKRKYAGHHNQLVAEDKKIDAHNKKARSALETLDGKETLVKNHRKVLNSIDRKSLHGQYDKCMATLIKAEKVRDDSRAKYEKILASGDYLVHTGSKKIPVATTTTSHVP